LLLDTGLLKAISEHIASISDDDDNGAIAFAFAASPPVDGGGVHRNSGQEGRNSRQGNSGQRNSRKEGKPSVLPIPPHAQLGSLLLTLTLSRWAEHELVTISSMC
jgi:hypothetical protein